VVKVEGSMKCDAQFATIMTKDEHDVKLGGIWARSSVIGRPARQVTFSASAVISAESLEIWQTSRGRAASVRSAGIPMNRGDVSPNCRCAEPSGNVEIGKRMTCST
jgi:hypothetical protein